MEDFLTLEPPGIVFSCHLLILNRMESFKALKLSRLDNFVTLKL